MAVGESAAVGVDRQLAAGGDAAPRDESATFALRAEAEVLEEQDLGWPVSRETAPPDVSRETALSGTTGLGWPDEAPNVLQIGEAR